MPVTYPPKLTLEESVPGNFADDTAPVNSMVGRVQLPGVVNSVQFVPSWSLTGTNTNFRTLSLYNRGPAGLGTALVAQLAMTSGVNLVQFVPTTITLSATGANLAVIQGDQLEWATTATLTGAPDTGGRVIVQQSAATR